MTAVINHMALGFTEGGGMAQPTVAAGVAKALMDLSVSKGASRRLLIERSRIDPDDLSDQNNRIPLPSYRALMEAGKELCNEPALALHFGEEVSMTEMSIVAPICEASGTAADALVQLNRLSRLLIDDGGKGPENRLQVTRGDGAVWLELSCDRSVDFPELTESSFARIASGFSRQFGDTPFARAVHFTHEDPGYRTEYERIFRAPVVFGSDKNALLIDEAVLSLKLSPSNPYVLQVLSEHADALLESLGSSKTLRGQVERLLIRILHTGELSMERIANKLGLSRQKLYRKLKAEGVSYQDVLDDLRHRMALQHLRDKNVSVQEAAARVGYSEPSAFSRAFKRWTGRRPSTPR